MSRTNPSSTRSEKCFFLLLKPAFPRKKRIRSQVWNDSTTVTKNSTFFRVLKRIKVRILFFTLLNGNNIPREDLRTPVRLSLPHQYAPRELPDFHTVPRYP